MTFIEVLARPISRPETEGHFKPLPSALYFALCLLPRSAVSQSDCYHIFFKSYPLTTHSNISELEIVGPG